MDCRVPRVVSPVGWGSTSHSSCEPRRWLEGPQDMQSASLPWGPAGDAPVATLQGRFWFGLVWFALRYWRPSQGRLLTLPVFRAWGR